MFDVLLHALGVAHGLGASLVFATCFLLAGSLLIPRRWDEPLGPGESPVLLGAAVYVGLCWIGVELGVAGKHVAAGFTGAVAVCTLVRHRWLTAALRARGVFSRTSLFWWGAFALLYLIAYVYTMPPVGGDDLPIAWMGNIDLLTYIRYTRYLWDLEPSNLVGFGYLNFIYLQTPGLFYLLGWFSMLFGGEPLSAAMPVQFALTALIGVVAARISHSVFGVGRLAGVAIGGIVIGAPFFRYVAGNYFLSTLMSTPVFLYLLWTTVSYRPSRWLDVPLMIRFAVAYVLLLYIYPFLLFAGIGAHFCAMALMWIAERQMASPGAWREAVRHVGRTAGAAAVTFGIVAVCLFQRLEWSFGMVTGLSQVGVAGWPLNLVSPLALFGFPGERRRIEVSSGLRPWTIAGMCGVAFALTYLYFWQRRRTTTPDEKALVALASGAILLYCAYYLGVGPSYQQWKVATYTILPLSFVLFAAVVRLARDARRPRPALMLLTIMAAVLVGGNLVVHARYDSRLVRLPGSLRNLEKVDTLPFFREISVQMRRPQHLFRTYLALYFLRSKRVHVISDRFEPSERLSLETISKVRPLLADSYECEGIGHEDTLNIPEVGCLLLAPPSPTPDRVYPFNQSFLFIEWDSMTASERRGRWNRRPTLNLRISADPERARLSQDAYVNLLLSPLMPRGVKPQRLVFSWGKELQGEMLLSDQEWISLPVRSADWSGARVWELPVSIAFPDGRRILFRQLSVGDTPRGRIVPVSRPGASEVVS